MIDDAWRNTDKMVEEGKKAEAYAQRAASWEARTETVNLSMPESLEYYTEKLEAARQYHADMREGKIARTHAYSLTYAKKQVNELAALVEKAQKLWGEAEELNL